MIDSVVLPTTREEILMWALGNRLEPEQSYARWHALEYSKLGHNDQVSRLELYVTELKRIRKWADQMIFQFPELTEVRVSPLGARIFVGGVYIA